MTNVASPEELRAPMGRLLNMLTYPPADFQGVTAPNADTLYSAGWVDVGTEPWLLSLPDLHGRYALFPVLDMWTSVLASPGKRTSGTGAQTWASPVPSGMGRCPQGSGRSARRAGTPSSSAVCIARERRRITTPSTPCRTGSDCIRWSSYGKPYTPRPGTVDANPGFSMTERVRDVIRRMDAATYFGMMARLMKDNPPLAQDAPIVAKELAALSTELAAIVERTGPSVVAVHARPRFSSGGVFWRPGVIVTAEHTIRREEEITVTLPDGSSASASLAGSDAGTDVAVLKVDSAAPAIPRASGDPSPGNLALALGRSENSGVNATLGIVSAVSGEWRTWRGGRLDRYIRLDLTLYPGSSGGPVVNTAGEAIGIATSALSRIAGLAIPASTVDRVVDEILARGRVARGYLGVGAATRRVARSSQRPDRAVPRTRRAGRPGWSAHRRYPGRTGGKAVSDTEDIQAALESRAVGQTVEADFLRGGVLRKVTITVGERPRRS